MNGINATKRCKRLSRRMDNGKSFWGESFGSTKHLRRHCHHVNRQVIREQFIQMREDFTEFLSSDPDVASSYVGELPSTASGKSRRSPEEHHAICTKDRRSFYRRATHCGAVTVTAGRVFFQKAM